MKKVFSKAVAGVALLTSVAGFTGVLTNTANQSTNQTVYASVQTGREASSVAVTMGNAKKSASVGSDYYLPTAKLNNAIDPSSITVSNTRGAVVVQEKDEKKYVELTHIGTHTVTYEFEFGGDTYVSTFTFESVKPSSATYRFESNTDSILPVEMESDFNGTIKVPKPTILDQRGEELTSATVTATVTKPDYTSTVLSSDWTLTENWQTGIYTIVYNATVEGISIISPIVKTFEVKEESENFKIAVEGDQLVYNYDLKYDYKTTIPTSWQLGKKDALPAVTGFVESQEVEVYYSVKAYKNSVSTANEVTSEVISAEEGTYFFTPNKKTKYILKYTVTDALGNVSDFVNSPEIDVADSTNPVIVITDPYTVTEGVQGAYVEALSKLPSKASIERPIIVKSFFAKDDGSVNYSDFTSFTRRIQNRSTYADVYTDTENANKDLVFNIGGTTINSETQADTEVNLLPNVKYRVYYTAVDADGNTSPTTYYDIEVVDTITWIEPTIEWNDIFPTEVYADSDPITFSAPTYSDPNDSRLTTTLQYQYAGDIEWTDLTVNAEGKYEIIIDGTKSSPLSIKATATNDGNELAESTKLINIVGVANDEDAPTLRTVPSVVTGELQGNEIELESAVFGDNNYQYLTVQVFVDYVNYIDEETNEYVAKDVYNGTLVRDNTNGNVTITGAKFLADKAGDYRVSYVATDAYGNSLRQYLFMEVAENVAITTKELSGLPTIINSGALELGKRLAMPQATILNGAENDSYHIEVIEGPTNYELTNNYFVAYKEGTYKLKYVLDSDVSITSGIYTINVSDSIKPELYVDTTVIVNSGNYESLVKCYNVNMPSELTTQYNAYIALEGNEGKTVLNFLQETDNSYIASITMPTALPAKVESQNTFVYIPGFSASDENGTGIDTEESVITIYSSSAGTRTIKYADQDTAIGFANRIYQLNYQQEYTITYTAKDLAREHSVNSATTSYTMAVGDTISPVITISEDAFKTTYAKGSTLVIDEEWINPTDNKSELSFEDVEIVLKNTSLSKTIESQTETSYSYELKDAGEYTLTINVSDEAGHKTTKTVKFTVDAEDNAGTSTTQVLEIVLITISVLVLAGVIVYFVVSKKKNDALYNVKKK